MVKIGIIGFGKFGQLLYKLLADDFEIYVYEKHKKTYHNVSAGILRNIKIVDTPKELYKEVKTVFLCIPISLFAKTISDHSRYFNNHLLIDVLPVKVYPLKIFRKYLTKQNSSRAMLTHPMFSSFNANEGSKDLSIVMDNYSAKGSEYSFWKNFFKNKKLKVIEMDSKKHDRLVAQSEGVMHFICRLLNEINFEPLEINTTDIKKLYEVKENVCSNDTFGSFLDQQNYNAFTKDVRLSLDSAYDKLYNKLLPERVDENKLVYGIQGGNGSFNEEAINTYIKKKRIPNAKIKYLYTTESVLRNLKRGNIDYGQFAIENTLGGMVGESLKAIAKYRFEIVDEFYIQIRHFLMKKPSVNYKDITTVMAHPQVLKQCAETLKKNYPRLKLVSGEADLIDTANVAKALYEGKLEEKIAILGPKRLAEIYSFDIVAEDLQDSKNNFTTFLIVKRK